jgi:hypothetical protein
MQSDFGGWGRVYSGVALTSLATLLFELSLTRIFSVVFYYHFAFLAISIALFGLGAGGVFSYVLPASKDRPFAKLAWLSALNSLLVCLALAVVLLQKSGVSNWSLALVYFTTALPFCGQVSFYRRRSRKLSSAWIACTSAICWAPPEAVCCWCHF